MNGVTWKIIIDETTKKKYKNTVYIILVFPEPKNIYRNYRKR